MRWYLSSLGKVDGPFEAEDIQRGIADGTVKAGLSVRDEASSTWTPIEISPFAPLLPPKARRTTKVPPGAALLVILGSLICAYLLFSFMTGGKLSAVLPPSALPPSDPSPPDTALKEHRVPECDLYALWFDSDEFGGEPKEREAQAIARAESWTPECRWRAFESECTNRCDDLISNMLIEASASREESSRIYEARAARNRSASKLGTELLSEFAALGKKGRALRAKPKSSECITRMRADFESVSTLAERAQRAAPKLPIGFTGMEDLPVLLRACLDCSDSGAPMCDEFERRRKDYQDILSEYDKRVRSDEHLSKLPK